MAFMCGPSTILTLSDWFSGAHPPDKSTSQAACSQSRLKQNIYLLGHVTHSHKRTTAAVIYPLLLKADIHSLFFEYGFFDAMLLP